MDTGHIPLTKPCPECDGEGAVSWSYYDRNGKYHNLFHDCPICNGECDAPNGNDIAVGIYEESFIANPLIKLLYAMKAFAVDYVSYSPSGNMAAQFNLKEGVDIIIMPQTYLKPHSWIKKKDKIGTNDSFLFYVDDYRFANLWKNPAKVLNTCARAVIEPNFSLFDTTPLAQGLDLIYRKRWLARYFQECGLNVYADLNVSSKFYEVNRLGIPQGYNAFATRGTRGHVDELEAELMIASEISGENIPNLIVYGGGQEIHEFCNSNSLVYIHDFMTEKGGENG